MIIRRLNIEACLYALAILLAVGLRFYHLGAAPLTDNEAEWALQALQVAQPEQAPSEPVFGPNPAYLFLTGVTFDLLWANNTLARFWPALAGSLIVILPIVFRRRLGRTAALILVFGLAIDPGLVTISRVAGGPAMALGFGLTAVGMWYAGTPILSGILAGLALISGPGIIIGMLPLALTGLVIRITRKNKAVSSESNERPQIEPGPAKRPPLIFLLTAGVTCLSVGTLFLQYPQGFGAWAEIFTSYFQGWVTPSGVTSAQILAALVFFQPFALLFALIAALRWLSTLGNAPGRSKLQGGLTLVWMLFGLTLILVYPAKQVGDLIWVLVPIWALAAVELARYLPMKDHFHDRELTIVALAQAAVVLILASLFWMTMIATNKVGAQEIGGRLASVMGSIDDPYQAWLIARAVIMLGILLLGVLTSALVALGWSWAVSRDGTIWGLSAAFAIYMIAALWGAAQLRPHYPQELWGASPPIQQADLFETTLRDLSNRHSGFPNTVDVVSTIDAPSIRWIVRNFDNAQFVDAPPTGVLPTVVITRQENTLPALSAAYRGQDFAWWVYPGWQGALPAEFVDWLAFRRAPLVQEHIILWARADIFPGGVLELEEPPEPQFDEID